MKRRNHVRLVLRAIAWAYWPLAFGVIILVGVLIMPPVAFGVSVIFVVARKRPTQWMLTKYLAKIPRYMREGRYAEARELIADLREIYAGSRSTVEQLRMQDATLLSFEERNAEAASLFASLDRKLLGARLMPLYLNNYAWSVANAGDGASALALARESLAASDESADANIGGYDLRAYQLGTLGAALTLAGHADEAVPALEQALARGGAPREQSSRAYFLGEAFRALGKKDKARAAYERAITESDATIYAKKSRAQLERNHAYRT